RQPAREQGEALRDDAHVAAKLAAAVGRRGLHRERVRVEAALVTFERGLDRMQEIVDLGRVEVAVDLTTEPIDRAVGARHESEQALPALEERLVADVAVADGTRPLRMPRRIDA